MLMKYEIFKYQDLMLIPMFKSLVKSLLKFVLCLENAYTNVVLKIKKLLTF